MLRPPLHLACACPLPERRKKGRRRGAEVVKKGGGRGEGGKKGGEKEGIRINVHGQRVHARQAERTNICTLFLLAARPRTAR